ncbi:MarR family winged helix-turn-helix transcriptional regulator [Pleionea sediminis]|uniref:MarR family winged helix-turn-helix transcriptional regulator n=1 Tax=Pleionea sediminis TaxID=2569479 RepID=UPI001187084E|nr:MarR family winged helix-turn-helix transcriptional regulator [Pleionea sediminis]
MIDLSNHLPFRIAVLSNTIKRTTSETFVANSSMSPRDWRVLVIIGVSEKATASMIVEMTGMDKATVTRACQSLEKQKLIYRKAHPEDKRSTLLRLTQVGQQEFTERLPQLKASDKEYRSPLTEGEAAIFLELINKLQIHADKKLQQSELLNPV